MGAHDIELVGVNDPHIGYDRYAQVAGPASDEVALTMGLVHAPYQRVLDAMVSDGASVVLAGHTHGGQLAVPLYGALVTNCDLDTGRAKGVSRWWPGAGSAGRHGGAAPSSQAPEDAAWLHVSAGLGTSPFAPVRFACRPEATLLTLLARDA
jgi:predicted MPP superfamily phosphohydrolase